MALQLLLIKRRDGDDAETPTWESGDKITTHEKMTVLGKHFGSIPLGKNAETAGFHQRGIRLVKILHLFKVDGAIFTEEDSISNSSQTKDWASLTQ